MLMLLHNFVLYVDLHAFIYSLLMAEWQDNKYCVLYCSWHGTVRGKRKLISHPCLLGAHLIIVPFKECFAWGLRFIMNMMAIWRLRQCSIGSEYNPDRMKTFYVLIDCMPCLFRGCSEVPHGRWICAEPAVYWILQQNHFYFTRVCMWFFILIFMQVMLPIDLFSWFFSNHSHLCHLFKGF